MSCRTTPKDPLIRPGRLLDNHDGRFPGIALEQFFAHFLDHAYAQKDRHGCPVSSERAQPLGCRHRSAAFHPRKDDRLADLGNGQFLAEDGRAGHGRRDPGMTS